MPFLELIVAFSLVMIALEICSFVHLMYWRLNLKDGDTVHINTLKVQKFNELSPTWIEVKVHKNTLNDKLYVEWDPSSDDVSTRHHIARKYLYPDSEFAKSFY